MNHHKISTVSIIIACYNSQNYISHTINSVLNQSYSNWEIIIVDDCSTDNSASIVKNYCEGEKRIKYFKTPYPSGSPTLPRNIGIENALGRYIAFLDSDDVWLPNKLEEQLKLFNDEHTAVVYSNYEKVDETGKREHRIINAPLKASYKTLLKGNVIGNLTGVYDTHKVGKVFCQNIHHEDYILWLSILKKGYIARNTGIVHALYRVRKQSVSANKLTVISWQWNIYRNIERLSCVKSIYYFIHYACRAFIKNRK